MQSVAQSIEKHIKDNGVKKVFIYKGLGISKSAFRDKMRGKTEFTTKEFLAMCKLLRCKPSDFMNTEDEE
jgi:DNA-binding Xre family transcriptional regulator